MAKIKGIVPKKHPLLAGIFGGVLFALVQSIIDYFLMGGQPSLLRIVIGGIVFGAIVAFLVFKA